MSYTYTPAQLATFGTPAAAFVEQLKTNPGPQPYNPKSNADITGMRRHRMDYLDTQRTKYPIPGPIPDTVHETDIYIDYPPSATKLQVRVYYPTNPASTTGLPVIVLMHEGGFMVGDISDEAHNARLFVASYPCIVLNIEYLLAPENAFPAAHLSCYHILETLCTSPATFHARANPTLGLVVGGSSAGGNLAAMLVHYSRKQGLAPPVTGAWLSVPWLFPKEKLLEKYKGMYVSGGSKTDPIIDPGEDESTFRGMLAGSQVRDLDHGLLSPFSTTHYPPKPSNTISSSTNPPFPKHFIQAAGLDPLRDHAIIYARALHEDWNIPAENVELNVYPGYGHMHWTNWPEMTQSKEFWEDARRGMGWLLGTGEGK